jgi:hypothetical protein
MRAKKKRNKERTSLSERENENIVNCYDDKQTYNYRKHVFIDK